MTRHPRPRPCAPAAHRWRFVTSLVLGLVDHAGRYPVVKVLRCLTCHSAACEVQEVDTGTQQARVVAVGAVLPDGVYREVEVRHDKAAQP